MKLNHREEILAKINGVFCDVFDDDTIVLSYETTPDDIPDWDSLAQIRLMLAYEESFNVRISSKEIESLTNIGDLVDYISTRPAM